VFLFAYYLDSFAEYLKKHKRLRMAIRKMDDGRFKVRYYWSIYEDNIAIVDAEHIQDFVKSLVDSLGKGGKE